MYPYFIYTNIKDIYIVDLNNIYIYIYIIYIYIYTIYLYLYLYILFILQHVCVCTLACVRLCLSFPAYM